MDLRRAEVFVGDLELEIRVCPDTRNAKFRLTASTYKCCKWLYIFSIKKKKIEVYSGDLKFAQVMKAPNQCLEFQMELRGFTG